MSKQPVLLPSSLPTSFLLLPALLPLSLLLPSFSHSLIHQASDVDAAEALLGHLCWALAEGLVCLCVHVCGLTMEEEVIASFS